MAADDERVFNRSPLDTVIKEFWKMKLEKRRQDLLPHIMFKRDPDFGKNEDYIFAAWIKGGTMSGSQDLEEVQKEMVACKEVWESSTEQEKVTGVCREKLSHVKVSGIDKIVCIAVSNIREMPGDIPGRLEYPFTNQFQHLLAFDLANILGEIHTQNGPTSSPPLPIYAQDPVYSETIDKVVLAGFHPSMTVVDGAEGFRLMDNRTFLICVHAVEPLIDAIVDLAEGAPVAILIDDGHTRGQAPRVMRMFQKYDAFDMVKVLGKMPKGQPSDREHNREHGLAWLWEMRLLVRKDLLVAGSGDGN
jgi:hypothetical protein